MRAKRGLGQNFLVGSHYPQAILKALDPQKGETIIEIGPGRGALTGPLLESGAEVIAVELDRELIPVLEQQFGTSPGFRLIEADALTVEFGRLLAPGGTARVAANLPYYISTAILQRLIEQRGCLREMILMLQREVVERITAGPGGKEYGYLSVVVQFYCEAEKLFDVPPGAFRPSPKVFSSVLRLRVRQQPAAPVENEAVLIEVIKSLFAQRRKTISNNLRAARERLHLPPTMEIDGLLEHQGLDPRRRAETLTIDEIAGLTNAICRLL